MTERDKEIGERIKKAIEKMPDSKRWNLLYFVEGYARSDDKGQERVIHEGKFSRRATG